MKKQRFCFKLAVFLCSILLVFCSTLFCVTNSAFASTNTQSLSHLLTSRNPSGTHSIGSVQNLYNFDDTKTYTLMHLLPSGYMIANEQTGFVSEYSFEESIDISAEYGNIYYGGPACLYYKNGNIFINVFDSSEISISQAMQFSQFTQSIQPAAMQSTARQAATNTTVEVEKEYFSSLTAYGVNVDSDGPGPKRGTCGSLAADILLGYYDYFHYDGFLPNIYRDGNGTNEDLHQLMISYIDSEQDGTQNYEVSDGINQYFNQSLPNTLVATAHYKDWGKDSDVVKKLNNNQPALINIRESLGADSNHVVIVYGYRVVGSLVEYLVNYCWNGPNSEIWISCGWSFSTVYIEYEIQHITKIYLRSKNSHVIGCSCGENRRVEPHFFRFSGRGYTCTICGYYSIDIIDNPSIYLFRNIV